MIFFLKITKIAYMTCPKKVKTDHFSKAASTLIFFYLSDNSKKYQNPEF